MSKSSIAAIDAWLIFFGLVLGPLGLVIGNPAIAGFGNAVFIAGFFYPSIFYKKN